MTNAVTNGLRHTRLQSLALLQQRGTTTSQGGPFRRAEAFNTVVATLTGAFVASTVKAIVRDHSAFSRRGTSDFRGALN